MSNTASIDDLLKRVEQKLDALYVVKQSSKDFREACDQLDLYLNNQKAFLMADGALLEPHKSRVAAIIERLTGLQKRAEIRADIPTALQKYIAEQSD
jgi:hypothetical protein